MSRFLFFVQKKPTDLPIADSLSAEQARRSAVIRAVIRFDPYNLSEAAGYEGCLPFIGA
jgi:hypothetical protein